MKATVTPTDATQAVTSQVTLIRRLPAPAMRRALRESAGLSTGDVARALGVTRQAVSNWERGKRTPRGAYLDSYVQVLERIAHLNAVA
ncbi:helix-turn-helix transcriptional regulator [Kribbella deserti]|uniref:Helix-turn-helix transcriptional regulator n=1 Tax=Kribbella deserti TaxID=1926257 RepID=A0ABV6QEZ9_9ACTN